MKRLSALLLFILLLVPLPSYAANQKGSTLQNSYAGAGDANGKFFDVAGYTTATIQVSGTFSGTVIPEVSVNGSRYDTLTCYLLDGTSAVTSFTSGGTFRCNITGSGLLRTRVSVYVSGAITVDVTVTDGGSAALATGAGGGSTTFRFDSNGNLLMSEATCISGESACIGTSPNSYLMVTGAASKATLAGTGIATNQTSATFTIPSGAKTPLAKVEGTGAVTQTWTLFGAYDSTATLGNSLCVITLSASTKGYATCDSGAQLTKDYAFYYFTTTNTTGTGATGELIVYTGISASGTGGGGGGDASAANQTTLNTSVGPTSDASATAGSTGSVNAKLRLLTTLTTDPCASQAKNFVTISQTTGTQLFTGTASMRTYVCSIHVVTATTQNIALVSGTGTVCATGTGAMAGGTTAATGWNLGANGGIVLGDGGSAIAKSKVDADNICILMSSTGQLSGTISYVAAAN